MLELKKFKQWSTSKEIRLAGVKYKPYLIGKLPSRFAFIYNEDKNQEGVTQWFNYKGFTYIEKQDKIW